jgi:serine/threonine protein kinase
MIEDDMDLFE